MESPGAACKGASAAVHDSIHAHLEKYVARMESIFKGRAIRALYKNLKSSVGLDGSQAGGRQPVKYENGVMPRSKGEILQMWARFFGFQIQVALVEGWNHLG